MKIDFVVPWVNDNDPVWQKEKQFYMEQMGTRLKDNGTDVVRFRNWELMRYWFRGVEKFAPWVNKIFFVTCGHVPSWLNLDHPKLRVVKHSEFIPEECLPTFNTNTIELYLHRIEDLSEHFVLLNDDLFLIGPVTEEEFFKNGLPLDSALLDAAVAENMENCFPHMMINNAAVINQHFVKKEVLRKHAAKFYSPKYGKDLIRNLLLTPMKYFSMFRSIHTPASYLKSSFEEVWQAEEAVLYQTTLHRFRSKEDVTDWLIRDWQMCKGAFIPRSTSWNRCFELGLDPLEEIIRTVRTGSYKVISINDSFDIVDFQSTKQALKESFEYLLPEVSAYEN